jgi:hypothetical protein
MCHLPESGHHPGEHAVIVIAKYPVRHVNAFAHISEAVLKAEPGFRVSDVPQVSDQYAIGWGVPLRGCPGSVMETGFFWDAAHLDTQGMYDHSALASDAGFREVMNHALRPLHPHVNLKSKYSQTSVQVPWKGVVLACQNPGDRSITSGASPRDYWAFVEKACRFYGKNLLLKLHPWNNGGTKERMEQVAAEHGCTALKCDHSAITECEFVLAWNSTFLVDCMVRGVRCAAFVPSAFSRYCQFTNGQCPREVPDTGHLGEQFVNFLAHRYCFNHTMTKEKTLAMFKHYAQSRELFPMTDEYSYAMNPSDPAAKGRRHLPAPAK